MTQPAPAAYIKRHGLQQLFLEIADEVNQLPQDPADPEAVVHAILRARLDARSAVADRLRCRATLQLTFAPAAVSPAPASPGAAQRLAPVSLVLRKASAHSCDVLVDAVGLSGAHLALSATQAAEVEAALRDLAAAVEEAPLEAALAHPAGCIAVDATEDATGAVVAAEAAFVYADVPGAMRALSGVLTTLRQMRQEMAGQGEVPLTL